MVDIDLLLNVKAIKLPFNVNITVRVIAGWINENKVDDTLLSNE